MVGAIARLIGGLSAAGHGHVQEVRQAAPHVLAYFCLRKRRQSVAGAHVVHARSDRREAIRQSAVEIEENCAEGG